MNIKGLLLGSAAALIAVSGARAADAVVVADPEPAEYVRVCDAYGAGFFYIPGTETCLQISGYAWYQITASSQDGTSTTGFNDYFGANRNGWAKSIETRVNFDARSQTEWGTLRSYIRVQATWNPGVSGGQAGIDGPLGVDQAIIELGGLRLGYTESAWADTQYGGSSGYGSHTWGGLYYGYQQRAQIAYSFKNESGLFGTVSLEDDANGNYIPDVVGLVGVNQGWGTVWARAAYDQDTGTNVALSGISGWAASVGAHINIAGLPGDSFRLIGYYANNQNAYSVGGRWSVLGSYYHQFSPKLGASVGVQYIGDTNYAAAGTPNLVGAELAVIWTPVTNFEVRTEINYDKASTAKGTTSGFLRFTRYF